MKLFTIPKTEREMHFSKLDSQNFFWVWTSSPKWIKRLQKSIFLYDIKIEFDKYGKNALLQGKLDMKALILRNKPYRKDFPSKRPYDSL